MEVDSSGRAFTQLLDKGLASAVQLACWSPTMDLLALSTFDGQLCVHRLNWQRLWTVTPEAPVTALCWRPDGKVLASGHDNGSTSLLDVEDGQLLERLPAPPGAPSITALSWVEEAVVEAEASSSGTAAAGGSPGAAGAEEEAYFMRRAPRLLAWAPQPFPAAGAPPVDPYADASPGPKQAPGPGQPDHLTVLAAASSSGSVGLSAFGTFPIASVDVCSATPSAASGGASRPARIHKVMMSRDLRHLFVVWEDSGGAGEVQLTIFATACFAERRREIYHLTLLATGIGAALKRAEESLAGAEKEWAAAMAAFRKAVQGLDTLLRQHASMASAPDELLALLGSGAVSAAMHQFLTSSLGEAGLKKVGKAVDGAVAAVHALLAGHAQPAVEAAAFQLGELAGLADCALRMACLGLQAAQVRAAEERAAGVMLRAEAARLALVRIGAQFRTFFAWLLRTVRHLNEEARAAGDPGIQVDPRRVAGFLQGQFNADMLEPELAAPQPPHQAAQENQPPACSLPELIGAPVSEAVLALAQPAALNRAALRQQLAGLAGAAAEICGATPAAVSPTIAPLLTVPLGPATTARCLALSLPQTAKEGAGSGARLAVLHRSGEDANAHAQLVVLRVTPPARGTPGKPQVEAACIALGGDGGASGAASPARPEQVVDCGFYRDARLALLLQAGGDAGEGALPPPGRLVLLHEEVPFKALEPGAAVLPGDAQQVAALEADGAARVRVCVPGALAAPLAVSGPRGVACVFVGLQRAVLYDLEDDEEEEEEDEDGEGEGQQGEGAGGGDEDLNGSVVEAGESEGGERDENEAPAVEDMRS